MAYGSTGTFANVSGASSAAAGQIVQSAVWNAIHVDYSAAFTQVMQQLISTVSNRNILWMNGGFEIWQRGAGSSSSISVAASTTSYTADRWYVTTGANQATVIAAATALSSQSQLACSVTRTAAQTGTTAMTFGYPLDSDEVIRMRGKKVTISFLASTGANWSPTNGTLVATLYVGTGAVAKRGGGFTSETTVVTVSTNLAAGSSATAVSATSSAVVPTTATQAEIQFTWTPVGTAGAADTVTIDDVQIEDNLSSSTWTPMNFDRLDFPTMLQGCKRHYQKTFPYSTAPAAGGGMANSLEVLSQAATRFGFFWIYPVELRTNPTFSKFNPATATSSFWYTLATVSVGVSASLSAVIDTQNNTNATKGVLILGATAAAENAAFIHAMADAGI